MADLEQDRLSIPSSMMNEQDERRNRRYGDEARNQDLSHADDSARDIPIPSPGTGNSGVGPNPKEKSRRH